MALLTEQEELLTTLVEAARNVPRQSQQFMLSSFSTDQRPGTDDFVEGGPIEGRLSVLANDVHALARAGLLDYGTRVWGESDVPFTISADGFAYYEKLRQRNPDPTVAIEEDVRRYLDATFNERFPAAYERLVAAEQMLWQASPSDDFTTIGHKLREALQQFATAMVERHQPGEVDADPAKTKNRLRAVVDVDRARLGEAKSNLLNALADYHDAVNQLVQRQEHGDQKPGEPLTWDDARAAVFYTALLMYEFDRLLNTTS